MRRVVTSLALLLASSCAHTPPPADPGSQEQLNRSRVATTEPIEAFCGSMPDNCLPYEAVVREADATRGHGRWDGATVATCEGFRVIRRGTGGCEETRIYGADGKLVAASSRCDGEAQPRRWGVVPIVPCAEPRPLPVFPGE